MKTNKKDFDKRLDKYLKRIKIDNLYELDKEYCVCGNILRTDSEQNSKVCKDCI